MSWELIAVILFVGLLVLLASGLPVAFALGSVAMISAFFVWGPDGASVIASTAYAVGDNYLFIAVPLFIMMGEVASDCELTGDAFVATDGILGRLPGGLAIATVGTACIFGAVSGASIAACAAVGTMALPEMFKRGYDRALAVGAVGGGACLDILIPPSILMVLYGFISGVSISKLFFAGIVPGLLSAGMFSVYIIGRCILNPNLAPGRSTATLKETVTRLVLLLPLIVLMVVVLGSMWLGVATPSEAAGIGVFGALLFALARRRLNWRVLKKVTLSALKMSCMLYFIIIGATFFTQLLAYVGVAASISESVTKLPFPPWLIVVGMQVVVIFLGFFVDAGSILLITTPIFVPVVVGLGLDPLWFGILIMINCELSTITPPVGLNLYVLKGVSPDTPFSTIVRGVAPYWFLHLMTMVLVGVFPPLATWLPGLMKAPV
ncbi:MAG: TRAP transporter large permease subunit [Pseudomonadota bacterium]